MEKIKGDIRSPDFLLDLKKVSDLLEYDGPILSHFIDNQGGDYLFYWVDYDNIFNRWLVWRVSKYQISDYINKQKSLRDLLYPAENCYTYSVDIDNDLNYHNLVLVAIEDLPSVYMPEKESYFAFDAPQIYSELEISEGQYVDDLRKRATYYKLVPSIPRFKSAITAESAARFFTNITSSFLSYAENDFFKQFKDAFDSFEYKARLKSMLSGIDPLVADLKYESFGVALSIDTLHAPKENNLRNWQKNLLDDYKSEVIDIDYNSDEKIEEIINKYTEEERRKIFEPIIKIINDKDFKLTVSDSTKTIKKEFKKIEKRNVDKIIPKKEKEQDLSQNRRFFNLIVEMEGDDISRLGKRELLSGLLFSNEVPELQYKISSISKEGFEVRFKQQISINLRIENNRYFAMVEDLDIYADGEDRIPLIEAVEQKLWTLVKSYFSKPDQLPEHIFSRLNEIVEPNK